MDFELTLQQKHIQAQARQFAEQEVAPVAREADEKGQFPLHLVKRMGELGFLAGPIEPEYGESSMDYVSYALLCEELGRADSSVRGFLTVHTSLVSMCIRDWGTEEQKRRYLPRLATGEWIGCYALTEPNAGSDVAGMETLAREEGDYYILDGEKIWITNGISAHVAIVFASRDRSARHRGICAFLVETNTPGFYREPMPGKELGHRASEHVHIMLKECRVPKSALLGAPGEGFKVAMSALDRGRLGVAAGAVGVAQACLDACISFATQRPQFGQRIADFEMIQATLADMAADVEAARLLVYRASGTKEQGRRRENAAVNPKAFAQQAVMRATS